MEGQQQQQLKTMALGGGIDARRVCVSFSLHGLYEQHIDRYPSI
jgi:hypothetical protein